MIRQLLIVVLTATLGCCVDRNIFKNCSQVEFCQNLRGRTSNNKYEAVDFTPFDNTIDFTLKSDDSQNLTVTLSLMEEGAIRVKISEASSSRYELQDVLDGEPKPASFDSITRAASSVTIKKNNNRIVVENPFVLRIYADDLLIFELDGARLVLENNESSQAFAFAAYFPQATETYGIHEHADRLALNVTESTGSDPYRLRNLDVPGYEVDSPMALYGAIPVVYGHGPNVTSGMFLHNAAEQWYDISKRNQGMEVYIMAESGSLDLFVLVGPTPKDVVKQYVTLTGTAHMPQLWTLGYHQCRWNYDNQTDVKEVVANFDNYNFPMDAIWLDIEYTDGKRYFTWDPQNFADPEEMQRNLSATNRHLVTIIDPHIKVDDNYSVYTGALEKDLFVKSANGSVFQGDCWPGLSSYMDFLNPEARSYYASWYSYQNFAKSTPVLGGIWNDMNEPSVFDDTAEKTMPGDALHIGNVKHRDIHNIYGLLHTMSTHQGLLDRDNGTKRPFILTRSHFAGSQRYTAFWTGDNTADWGYLAVSYPECLNANLLGLVFCGADVGGFFNDPTEELLQRWYQAGVWLPFYRAHANLGNARREPYLYPKEVQEVIRSAIEMRYKHLPVWYTLFFEHVRTKEPIIRPLFYNYPQDTNVFKIDHQLILGTDIMVRAVTQPGVESVQVYFPGGADEFWYSATSNDVYRGEGSVDIAVDLKSIPVYYRSGSVIVRKDTVRKSSADMSNDGHTLYIFLDKDEKSSGKIYLDDNTSFKYRDTSEYSYIKLNANSSHLIASQIDEKARSGDFAFIVDRVVYNYILEPPQNGNPGKYASVIHDRDVNGNKLKDIKFDFSLNEGVSVNFKSL